MGHHCFRGYIARRGIPEPNSHNPFRWSGNAVDIYSHAYAYYSTPTATPTFAVTGGLHATLPSSTPTATFTPTATSIHAPTTTSTSAPTATPTPTENIQLASEALNEFIFCERLRVLNELEWGISPSTVYSDNRHYTGVIPESVTTSAS